MADEPREDSEAAGDTRMGGEGAGRASGGRPLFFILRVGRPILSPGTRREYGFRGGSLTMGTFTAPWAGAPKPPM